MKTSRLSFLKLSSIAALTMAIVGGQANAAVIINVTEVGGNVVFDVAGSLNLTGAVTAQSGGPYSLGFISGGSNWYIASGSGNGYQGYEFTSFDGAFGTDLNFYSSPSSSFGDNFFIWGQGGATEQVGVDPNYVSGSAISAGMVFNNWGFRVQIISSYTMENITSAMSLHFRMQRQNDV